MRVLVGCEHSGIVRSEFEKLGHDAWSCDLLPSEKLGNHLQCDVLTVLDSGWDLAIFHPDCTYLCSSGLHWNRHRPGRSELTDKALEFVQKLLAAPIPKMALENPIGCISTRIRKPEQIIQPWMFGHDESKSTCLWLNSLSPLKPTLNVKRPAWIPCPDGCDDFYCQRHGCHTADCPCQELDDWVLRGDDPYRKRYTNQTPSGQNKLGPSEDRWANRARTYLGVAQAMAAQWGGKVNE